MKKVYIIGSLRNPDVPFVAEKLREDGHLVFDDWFAAGERADDAWKAYEEGKGNTLPQALLAPAAKHVMEFDKRWLTWADTVILLMPAGKSGHLELGWSLGRGKEGHVLFPGGIADRWDVMYGLANGVWTNLDELREELKCKGQ